MARDLKLAIQFTSVSAAANQPGVTATTPSGDKANTQVAINLTPGSGTSTAGATVSNTFNLGFRNSMMDSTSFANFIAGNELTAITNDPPVWGNTSTAEMYLRGVLQWDFSTVGTPLFDPTLWPYVALQGAVDNGSGSAVAASWSTVSGIFPLQDVVATIASSTTAPVFTTSAAHNLVVNDAIVFGNVSGVSAGLVAATVYQVNTVPTATTFTLKALGGSAIGATTGTLTGTPAIYKLRGYNTGSAGIIFSVPLVETVRPHYRLQFYYPVAANASTLKINLLKCGLVTGRENAPRD